MSDEESDPGEDRVERKDSFSETDLDMQNGLSQFTGEQQSPTSEDELLGAVARHMTENEIDDQDPLRATMAHLFDVICTGEDDIIREELFAHKHLLDREIVINVSGHCRCPYHFEKFSVCGLEVYAETVGKIKELIQDGSCKCQPANEKSSSRRLLDIAAGLGKLWLIEFLLDQGCEIDVYTRYLGYSPLLIGIINANTELVRMLVDRGANLNQPTPVISYPLLEAVRVAGHHKSADNTILKILLDTGQCDLNATNERKETALEMAVGTVNAEAVQMLLEMKANPNVVDGHGDSLLYMATTDGESALVAALIEAGADVNAMNESEGETALHVAVYTGNSDIVSLLLSNGADASKPTRDGYPPIVLAVDGMYPEILESLIKKGAAVDFPSPSEFTALHNAAWDGYKECLDILLAHGASPDALTTCKNTPLALAAHGNHFNALFRLLMEDVNVNNADKDLDTPLHYAAYNGCAEGVKLLLERGANPNVINKFNASPLWNAVYMDRPDVVRALILSNVTLEISSRGNDQVRYNGVDVVPLYPSQKSVLWVAVERRCADIVDLLVEAGYNLWREKWLIQNNEVDIPEASLPIVHRLQALVQQAPSLMLCCRNFFRAQFNQSQLECLVRLSPLPGTLKDFLLLKHIGQYSCEA